MQDQSILSETTLQGKVFQNPIPTSTGAPNLGSVLKRYWNRPKGAGKPAITVPVNPVVTDIFTKSASEKAKVTWMGHSSLLMEIGGLRWLLDPVLSQRVSMVQWAGPKRRHQAPLRATDISAVDVIVLSHDHYDHMDYGTITTLASRTKLFLVPLGLKKILVAWGVEAERIKEFRWWEEFQLGFVRIICTPARHFSGRGLVNRNTTLWSSWTFITPEERVFFCGDSGAMPLFTEIGKRFGPFDLTLMPIGAYDPAWQAIHTNPREAVDAHSELGGKLLLPIHWATFDLALHSWSEPVEWLWEIASKENVGVTFPQVGQTVDIHTRFEKEWWRK